LGQKPIDPLNLPLIPNYMTAKTSTKSAKNISPFEQIVNTENEHEQRVVAATEKAILDQKDAEKLIAASDKEQEELIRKKASDDLKQYELSEPAAILKEHEEATHEEIKSMKASMSKHMSKKAESLAGELLKKLSSFLSA